MKRFKGTKGIILLVAIVILIVGYYHYLSNRRTASRDNTEYEVMTRVQEVLSRNLETYYPATPREVVRYFSDITQCFYNEEYSDDELYQMAIKIRGIYDDKLVQNQTEEEYLEQLKKDIADFKENNRTISSYSLPSTVDVETYQMDGDEWARLYCLYSIKEGVLVNSNMRFLLRRDAEGHYKIYGWELVKNADQEALVPADASVSP